MEQQRDRLEQLNPEQRAAVMHGDGPLLILAGAGSGKTRVITYRIAELIERRGVTPQRILAVTFTNKAAGEMRERIEKLVGSAEGMWVSTFHAFGARILRRHAELLGWGRDFVIYDENDTLRLGRVLCKEMDLDPRLFPVEKMLYAVERAKHRLKDSLGESGGIWGQFHASYQKRLKQANAFDFADLIFQTHRLWKQHPEVLAQYRERFAQVLVDEFQDTDQAQYGLLRLLCPPEANLCVVGDDDQSIYMWRGAEVAHILGFKKDYPAARVVKLEQNYRSTASILEAATQVIARNQSRHPKTLWTASGPGEPVDLFLLANETEEADFLVRRILAQKAAGTALSDMAVLYRVNAQSRALEEGFRTYGVPYRLIGGTRFFDRLEVRDVLAYLRLINNPRSDVDLLRVINAPPRGIGEVTQQRLNALAAAKEVSIWEVLTPGPLAELRSKDKVLEFRHLLEALRDEADGIPVAELIRAVLGRTGYAKMLEEDQSETNYSRLENLHELVTAAQDFAARSGEPSLEAFLEHVALVTDLDADQKGAPEAVSLMTLHAAKGLEFDCVFMPGMEENLLPHRRSLKDEEEGTIHGGVEEERRLCYVGMTRARKKLTLLLAEYRAIFGKTENNPPSRFIRDLAEQKGHFAPAPRAREAFSPPAPRATSRRADEEPDLELDDHDGWVLDDTDEYSQLPRPAQKKIRPDSAWLGRLVEHATFGRGKVLEAKPSDKGMKLLIHFGTRGTKTVFSSFVTLVD